MHSFDCFIFDLDGTLLDSSCQVIDCMRKAFNGCNLKADESKLNSNLIGPPLRDIIKMIDCDISEENLVNVIKTFREIYETDRDYSSKLYDGVKEFLEELKAQGKKIFMATFKPMRPTLRLVKEFDIEALFEDVYTVDKFGDYCPKEDMIAHILDKYGFDKSKTVMVGDAVNDVAAAKNTGIKGVGVLWGYGADKAALRANADCVISHIGELRCLKEKLKNESW